VVGGYSLLALFSCGFWQVWRLESNAIMGLFFGGGHLGFGLYLANPTQIERLVNP
jgi:hypothetical protein